MERKLSYVARNVLNNEAMPLITVGNTLYKGMNPQYQDLDGQVMKTVKGIPFVRSTIKKHEARNLELEAAESIGEAIETAIEARVEVGLV